MLSRATEQKLKTFLLTQKPDSRELEEYLRVLANARPREG
jgi:hypothetical protein